MRSTPSTAKRIGCAVGLTVGLLLIGWGLPRWAPFRSEPADTAPLDIRGQPIGAGPGANRALSIPPPVAVTRVTPPDTTVQTAAASGGGANTPAAEVSATPRVDVPSASGLSSVPETGPDGHFIATFDQLAGFTYAMPEQPLPAGAGAETLAGRIPPNIRALDRQRVAVKGFMLPMKLEHGRATELLLMRDQSMCCFGVVPKINEWLNVKMAKSVKPVMDQPVTIAGTLHVGEVVENGYLVYIYALDGESLTTALDE